MRTPPRTTRRLIAQRLQDLDNAANYGPGVYELMMDPETKTMRSDESFAEMWTSATPEAQTNFRAACTEWEKDKALFTDAVSSRCKMATPTGG